jgi:hypothetical protein
MKAKEYDLMALAVENGTQRGWNRAHKHTDKPDAGYILACVQQAVLDEICEWFSFDDVKEQE